MAGMETFQAVITHNVVPMRATPNDSAEQVSQAILSDCVRLLEETDDYARIQTSDDYTGWVVRRHLRPFAPDDPFFSGRTLARIVAPIADLTAKVGERAACRTKLVYGTRVRMAGAVRGLQGMYARVALVNGETGSVRTEALALEDTLPSFDGKTVCRLALPFLGTPYLWGGTTPFGFDCSGFVQRLYAMCGVILPRDAYLQAIAPGGATVPGGKPLRAGDLVFFCSDHDPRGRGITHVGMALDAKRFIHASGKLGVAITALDDPYYRRTYRSAWRYRK